MKVFEAAETADGIVDAIKAEADYIAKLSEAGKIRGIGTGAPNAENDYKNLVESFKRMGLGEEAAKTAAAGR